MGLNPRFGVDEINVAVSYASVESGVASFSAPRRRHPYEDGFRQRAPQQEIRIRDPPERRLLLVWASIGCRSDVVSGSDGVCWLEHGDDRPLFIWRSRPRLEVVSSCTEERASNVSRKLRFLTQRPRAGRMSKDILPFPLSAFPTAAGISLSLEAGRAQLGQAEEPEATLDEYIQEAGLEGWISLAT